MNSDRKLTVAISLREAVQHAPSLAHLGRLMQESQRRLHLIHALLPEHLRSAVHAGPLDALDSAQWCLLVNNNATAAKVRQLLPRLQAHLQNAGCKLTSIRLKIVSFDAPA
jgi:hypothetical protein